MSEALSVIRELSLDRRFASVEEVWEALLERKMPYKFDPFADHEDLFENAFRHRFGPSGLGTEWCVLRIHRDVDAFLITVSSKHFNEDFLQLLRDLLAASRPDDPVYLGIYEGEVTDYYGLIAALAVFQDRLWAWVRDPPESDA